MADLGALTPVGVVAVLYAVGLTRAPLARGLRLSGAGGIVALAFALGPPLDGWAATDLAAHMVQHVVLLAIAPPLLIIGSVPAMVVEGLSPHPWRWLTRASAFAGRAFARAPIVAWTALAVALQTAALGVWHVPVIYDAAAAHVPLHAAEHVSFLATGLGFWWLVAGAGRRAGTGAAVVTIFLASLPGTLLGALMTLSTAPWYPRYTTGTVAAALKDQQLAGVVMWAVGGMAYVAAGATLFVLWLRELERSSPARVGVEAAR